MVYTQPPTILSFMEWVMMGYRVAADAVPVEYDEDGEPLFSDEDVYIDDEDL